MTPFQVRRRGASIVELIGCLFAVAGGLLIGARYLGVDLKSVCASALKSADVAAPEWLADTEQAMDVENATAPAEFISTSAAMFGNDNRPSAAASDAKPVEVTADAPAEPLTVESARERRRDALGYLIPLTDQQKAVLTRAYWDELQAIIAAEEESRMACMDDACNLQLFDYLNGRRNSHSVAARAIADLNVDGVDPHVTTFSNKVLAWHEEGKRLFGRAIDLLTDAPTAQLTGPFAQSWQSAATQHRMEERLLNEKRNAVQSFLDHNLADQPATAPAAESK
ncbi:MAG: hypothetical protein KDA44_19990 [Planctomycetales bacterium]|nr:hypothetical protein [Planctomycetales bacterium]